MTIFVTTFFTLLFEGKLSEAKTKWRRNFRLPRLFSNTTTDVTKEKKKKKKTLYHVFNLKNKQTLWHSR